MKKLLCILLMILGMSCPAWALVTTEVAGVHFVYPEGEGAIVSRMAAELPGMLDFLDQRGLPVTRPLFVHLDEELDIARVPVHLYPHREIRIPLRAPGVLEEGSCCADPWRLMLFRGLGLQGLYSLRSGVPAALHHVFGEIVSPNLIFPPWIEDGVVAWLEGEYLGDGVREPLDRALFGTVPPPELDRISNHPEAWPGYYSYRIYGRPFVAWVVERYGWDGLLSFLAEHGDGIIPIEVDLKARKTLQSTWPALWREFAATLPPYAADGEGLPADGFMPSPLVYWNVYGVYPGIDRSRFRSRYGFRDKDGMLWLSEYDAEGISQLVAFKGGLILPLDIDHVWDPGPGHVAVSRRGSRPVLVRFHADVRLGAPAVTGRLEEIAAAPAGVVQLSGPVAAVDGRIAVAGMSGGNWDIWVWDGTWRRMTAAASAEIDPWWHEGLLVCASNASGSFQLCTMDLAPLTDEPAGALLPRNGHYLALNAGGWQVREYTPPDNAGNAAGQAAPLTDSAPDMPEASPYRFWTSVWPNYMVPDLFVSADDVQVGISTAGRDVSRDFTTDLGVRYSFDLDYTTVRLGGTAQDFGAQFSRYPLRYDSNLGRTEESRLELSLSWRPEEHDWLGVTLGTRRYEPLEGAGDEEDEHWAALELGKNFGSVYAGATAEVYNGGRRSVFGRLSVVHGEEIYSRFLLQAGRTWDGYEPGHGSFRIGGDSGEGYFTQRPSRLFAVRGFSSSSLEGNEAVTTGLEIFWPLANLQRGYKTLPLFLHRFRLGTFVDAGVCGEELDRDDLIVGAGFELLTSLEIAWGNFSSFRMGLAWPIEQPDYLDENGPRFLVQIGRPL